MILQDISTALQKGKAKEVQALVQQALAENIPAKDILEQGLLDGMGIIGGKFKNNEVYVPEVLIAARAMNMGAQILKPALAESGVKAVGKVILGTVKGDLHDIGKNLVRMMMEGKGLEVIDIGVDVPAEKFVEVFQKEGAQIVACSALLTTTMGEIRTVVEAFENAGIRDQVVIMCGGAPVTDTFAKSVGADIYTPDAASAGEVAAQVCLSK